MTKRKHDTFTEIQASALVPFPGNPRRGNVDAIRASIRANGFFGALVVRRSTREILAGNHRFLAGVAEGMTKFPVNFVDVDEVQARKILLADNRTGDLGSYDENALADILRSLSATADEVESAIAGTGYSVDEVAAILDSAAAPLPGAPPAEFPAFGDDLPTQHRCPKCAYVWSGEGKLR